MTDTRTRTCHPDDNPSVPCQRKFFSLTECKDAEIAALRSDLAAARALLREVREVVASRRQFQAGYPLPKHLQITPERADLARRIDAALAGEGNHG